MLKTLDECFEWLYEPRDFERKFDLSRMYKAIDLFNRPIDYKCIHVAGTNGKGSTVAYLKNMLIQAGYKVGTFISPFVVIFNERITLNNQYISDEDFIRLCNHVHLNLMTAGLEISFFEILTVIAFLYFEENEVDYAVIETGVGGRLDSTNVINKEVALITNVGMDHQDMLGDTLEKIAKEKLGIVDDYLITSVQASLRPMFEEYVRMRKSTVQFTDRVDELENTIDSTKFKYKNYDVELSMLGEHQASNASLAIEAILYLREHKGLQISDEDMLIGLKNTFWPGRLEKVGRNVYVDGSHNREGVTSLVNFLRKMDKKVQIVFSCLADKPAQDMIELLDDIADEIIFTQFDYPRAEQAETLFDLSNSNNKKLVKDYKDTLTMVDDTALTVYCGSLYFISLVRQNNF